MTRLFSIDDPDHAHASEVLPWYVNGSLSSAEHARVEHHIGECAACRAELAALRELQSVVQSEGEEAVEADALARMHARIAEDEARCAPARAGRRGWLGTQWRLSPSPVRLALGLQLVLVLSLGALAAMGSPSAIYRTLAATPSPAQGARLTVVFDDAATQGEIRRVLGRLHARIVEGPNGVGALGIEVPPQEVAAALEELRATPRVRLAAPALRNTLPGGL